MSRHHLYPFSFADLPLSPTNCVIGFLILQPRLAVPVINQRRPYGMHYAESAYRL